MTGEKHRCKTAQSSRVRMSRMDHSLLTARRSADEVFMLDQGKGPALCHRQHPQPCRFHSSLTFTPCYGLRSCRRVRCCCAACCASAPCLWCLRSRGKARSRSEDLPARQALLALLGEACLPPAFSRVTDAPLRGRRMHQYARRNSSWPIEFHLFALCDAQAV